jgi:hypothetical protein
MISRTGKIARLPLMVRLKLNCRLEEGEPHRSLMVWLNGLPEVKAMLDKFFGGRPITESNLTAWKQGGFAEWVLRRELVGEAHRMDETAMEFLEEHEERCRGVRMESFIQNLGLGLGFRYADIVAEYDRDPLTEALEKKVKVLRTVTHGVVSLQMAEVRSERLQLKIQQQTEEDRVKNEDFEERAWKWAEQPHIKQEIGESYNPKTQEQLVKEQDVMVREVKYTHTHDGIPFWKPGPGSPGYDRSKVNPDGSMGPILRAPPPPTFDRNGRLVKPSPTTEEWAAQSGQVIPLHGCPSGPPPGDKEKEAHAGANATEQATQDNKKEMSHAETQSRRDVSEQPKKKKTKKETPEEAQRREDEEMGREGPFQSEEEYQEDPNFDYEAAEASLFGPGGSKVGVLPHGSMGDTQQQDSHAGASARVLPHGSMGEGTQGTQRTEGTKNGGEDDDEDDKDRPQREGPKGEALEALREQFARQIRERKLERDIENEVITPQERARRLKVVSLSVKYKVPSPMRGPNNEIFPDIPPEVRRQYGVPEEEYFSKDWEVGGKNAPT